MDGLSGQDGGYSRIQGELRKLGTRVARATISAVLKRHQVPPPPSRGRGGSWRAFLRHHRQPAQACDFFALESLFLRTIYVLFFIDVRTRQVALAGCTAPPTAGWVTQQTRNVTWAIQEGSLPVTILIHDRDTKFPPRFDAVFTSEGLEVVLSPPRSPWAKGIAERFVRTLKAALAEQAWSGVEELEPLLAQFATEYNDRPHQGLALPGLSPNEFAARFWLL